MFKRIKNRAGLFIFCLALAAIASPAIAASDYVVPERPLKPLVGAIFFVIIGIMVPIAYLSNSE